MSVHGERIHRLSRVDDAGEVGAERGGTARQHGPAEHAVTGGLSGPVNVEHPQPLAGHIHEHRLFLGKRPARSLGAHPPRCPVDDAGHDARSLTESAACLVLVRNDRLRAHQGGRHAAHLHLGQVVGRLSRVLVVAHAQRRSTRQRPDAIHGGPGAHEQLRLGRYQVRAVSRRDELNRTVQRSAVVSARRRGTLRESAHPRRADVFHEGEPTRRHERRVGALVHARREGDREEFHKSPA